MEKRNAVLEKNMERLHKEAVDANNAGQKQKALLALKKKKMYEDQVKTNNAMLMRLLEQKGALESTMINSDALRAIDAATTTMKAEQEEWSADRVRDMTDELHELHANHREITEMIREPLSSDGPTEDELLEELGEMSATAAPAPVTVPAGGAGMSVLPELPVVPTTPIQIAQREEAEIQRQLAELVPS